ncbi:hypothetical protein B0H14DRAFT_2666517 [Mycena olivaceomarginata]|nr:hypothetical protein B0H14DRAFT_2666517 [Mycena olivaceomarginata]
MTDLLSLSFSADSSLIQYSNANWTQIDSGSTYLTGDANASATFNFNGTLIAVLGTVQFDQPVRNFTDSPLSYVLDGNDDLTFLFNASSPTVYASRELSGGPHTLSIRLISENTTLSISGGNITTSLPDEPPNGSHHRTIAIVAGTLGACIVLAVICLALFLFNRRQRQYPSTPYALGPLQANLPSTKEAFTSPKYSNHGIVFTQSTDSVNILPHVKAPAPPSSLPEPYRSPTPTRTRPKPAAERKRTLS